MRFPGQETKSTNQCAVQHVEQWGCSAFGYADIIYLLCDEAARHPNSDIAVFNTCCRRIVQFARGTVVEPLRKVEFETT